MLFFCYIAKSTVFFFITVLLTFNFSTIASLKAPFETFEILRLYYFFNCYYYGIIIIFIMASICDLVVPPVASLVVVEDGADVSAQVVRAGRAVAATEQGVSSRGQGEQEEEEHHDAVRLKSQLPSEDDGMMRLYQFVCVFMPNFVASIVVENDKLLLINTVFLVALYVFCCRSYTYSSVREKCCNIINSVKVRKA